MFHLRAKIIGRSGAHRSAAGAVAYRVGSRQGAAALAYRAGTKLRDPNSGRTFDYSAKARLDADGFGILHSEIMLPAGAPAWMADRQKLIDAVEARETRKDAQLFREIELSLPRELTFEQQRDLVRAFVKSAFVARGMVADVAIHDELASDGGRNPHAHILLTMREVTADGFGKKVRVWNAPALLKQWRETWAEMANEYLAHYGHEKRIDHRSHAERGIDLEPDAYVGPKRRGDFSGVIADARDEMRRAIKNRNADQIRAKPETLLDAITREKATFTAGDIAYALRRATDLERDDDAFLDLMQRVKDSPDLVPIASDQQGPTRYSTQAMISCEIEMAHAAAALAARNKGRVAAQPPASLSTEQQHAFFHVVSGGDLTCISGVAGAGKTTTLKAIAAALSAAGYRVRGAAIAGIAAKKLADEAAIPASTVAGLFYGWDRRDLHGAAAPSETLERGDALIIDEAGMAESRQMRRLLVEAERAGARVILVGDAQQLQAIGAGAAFRALTDTHGAARLANVRRQQSPWMRRATEELAEGNVAEALARYAGGGALRASATTKEAMEELVGAWLGDRAECRSQLMLSYYVADVEALNQLARKVMRAKGLLGTDIRVQVQQQIRNEDGEIEQRAAYRTFAEGDRILFTRNDKGLGVQNGSLGYVTSLSEGGDFGVVLDDGRTVSFAANAYGHIAPGYATTIHKSQGQTVDRAYVLATDRFNAHLAYVALTRHREEATVFYGRDQFESDADLTRTFNRQQPKDSTLDYLEAFKRGRAHSRSGDAGREVTTRSEPKTMQEVVRDNAARRRSRQHVRQRIRE
ncbi:MAG: Ti-type conjugative transfer relaxase TraA [Gammaproteobacteria bacterium]